ncbi:type I-E CRISPR-associated protein Cas7/Cse4/CasC [Ornithinimicrobium cavernae]|uniref:type I-E CRISPR-associated protein Cas7/Cse4/CasC n=1 Tax=Ornithinimicrobium cavernae TaxID=2666047 RepID=UPI000D698E36|nr:type I-E CRISPR-associated protein Cas7/Cse4/CasC [Ornithinimicrobium cavernae]
MSTYLDLHIIQTLPPSNVNRDDTGSPKSAVYGGVRRARVSSQAWKRATRAHFRRELDPSGLGYRTKQAAALIGERLGRLDPDLSEEDRATRAGAVLNALGMKLEPKRRKNQSEEDTTPYESTSYLAFFSSDQLDQLAELALSTDKPSRKEARERADRDHGISLSLFGRMVADDASLNVDASVQVAHALSTHAVDTEADYYTAVDDLSHESEESGAGMIGTIEFNSSTLYRYATVNVDALVKNMGQTAAAARAAATFVRSFATSMPTGKQNTFANGTVPDAVVLMVREDQPINLVGAFEVPVRADGMGYIQASCEALAAYAQDVGEAYGNAPTKTMVLRVGERTQALAGLGEAASLEQMGAHVEAMIAASAVADAP